MKASKRVILLAAFVVLSLAAHAQHFDWVKSYTGSDRPGHVDNWIVGSVSDSQGNLYVLGQCAHDAQIEGIPFVPINNHQECILIAKISPNGNIVWHKEIATPLHNTALSIRMIGDTAIVCMAGVTLQDEVYWLDTLYSDANHQLMSSDSLDDRTVTAFITLNLDGELLEHHFLQVAFLDSEGQVITTNRVTGNPDDSVTLMTLGLSGGTFCIDRCGNVIVIRDPSDEIPTIDGNGDFTLNSIENGLLSSIQILVDGHARFSVSPQGMPKKWNPMLLKFTPHFDTLITHQYLFQNEVGENTLDHIYSMIADGEGGIFVVVTETVSGYDEASANVTNLPVVFRRTNLVNSIVFKCDSALNPVFCKQLSMEESLDGMLEFHSLALDKNERNLFVSGHVYSQHETYPATIDSDTVDVVNKVFFLNVDAVTGQMNAYGKVKSTGNTGIERYFTSWQHQMCAENNRVFVPCYYTGNLFFGADSTYTADHLNNAICIWDTLGNAIGFIDMPTNSTNRVQPCYTLSLQDSILYISGFLESNSTVFLGDTEISFAGNSMAYIAKYVDTAFMTPYVHTEEPGEVSITLVEDGAALVAYPNPFRQKVTIEVQGGEPLAETAWLTDLTGHREQVRLIPQGHSSNNTFTQSHNQIYTLDLTSRPHATYLLTLTTASGKTHTVRLLKQSDIFSR